MTRFEPTLIVTRLVVFRNELIVYDELFHEGVNVVRGENSSGKSTVLNFIFYGLGGDLNAWSTVARLCTRVILEVRINGNPVVLSRDISDSGQQPMEIFGGAYDAAVGATREEWVRYPYKSSSSRESFSQALFRLMGIPEVSSDLSGHITMHQILRLLYADQLSPVEQLFRFEPFDRADLRDTVGRLLCGAYTSALYDNDQQIRALNKEFDSISGELKSLFTVLGRSGQALTPDWIEAERNNLTKERQKLLSEIEAAEKNAYGSAVGDKLTLADQDKAYRTVQQIQSELGVARQQRDALALTIVDSNSFIANLKRKIESLRDSSTVVEHIGEVQFETCPACYAPITDQTAGACHLCKTPFDAERVRERISALIMDAGVQVKQSEQLQKSRNDRVSALDERIGQLTKDWDRASELLRALRRLPSTEARSQLRELQRKLGYLDRQIEDLGQRAQLIASIQELSTKKDGLSKELSRLKTTNDALRARQAERFSVARTKISEEVKSLLKNDLRRQDIFEDPEHVDFSFSENRIWVDDENYFSASSRAILKSSFYLGFLAAATKVPFFRHPRFCMIDTHENMGVEAIRSQNFQLQILRVSRESAVEHQIIYATAMIEQELEDEAFTVGAFSTNDDLTLKIKMS
jgi:hypothetical protein